MRPIDRHSAHLYLTLAKTTTHTTTPIPPLSLSLSLSALPVHETDGMLHERPLVPLPAVIGKARSVHPPVHMYTPHPSIHPSPSGLQICMGRRLSHNQTDRQTDSQSDGRTDRQIKRKSGRDTRPAGGCWLAFLGAPVLCARGPRLTTADDLTATQLLCRVVVPWPAIVKRGPHAPQGGQPKGKSVDTIQPSLSQNI